MTYANFDIAALTSTASQPANQRDEASVRKMASDFEALLLRQLTSSINPSTDDEDGDSLFGQGGGISLSRQLFSEQMADTMAKNGGVGLADMILKQVMDKRAEKPGASVNTEAARALDAARSIRANSSSKPDPAKALSRVKEATPASTSKGRFNRNTPVAEADRYPDAIIISRASDTVEASASSARRSSQSLNAFSEVSTPASSDSVADDMPLSPTRPEGLLSAEDTARIVRPRRVHSLPKVEQSLPVSGITRASAAAPVHHAPSVRAVVAGTRVNAAPVSLQMYVRGPIRSRFGPRIDPIDKVPRFHRGIDIAAPMGTPIGAAAEGRVIFSGRNKGHGNQVVIEHPDGTVTRYGHASKLIVKEGDYVESGQTIALVGSTGHSTGPHLHFEVLRNGSYVDPLTVLPKAFALARR